MDVSREGDTGEPGHRLAISADGSSHFSGARSFEARGRGSSASMPEPVSPRRDRWPVLATIVAIVMGATALIAMREKIVRALPPAAAAYRLLGVPVNLAGLELRGVRAHVVLDGGRRVLVTDGEIVNIRREQNHVPPLMLAVRGANGLQRYAWTAAVEKSKLDPGERIFFSARLASPPEDGADVVVRFAGLTEDRGRAAAH